ncbi:MAG TPA: ATP cone domain-containing protein [archaeon]|nr:ATP cone domain-containing protein [archaeon]
MQIDKPIKEVLQHIAFECQESGATKWEVLKVLKELEQFEGTEQQIKKKAAEVLEKLNPQAAKTLLSFEKMKVYTTREKLEPFDRGNIIKSLLKETQISRHVAEKIGSEVEDKVKDLKIDYLNTHLIREMVNVKLLEYGHEPIHSEYARIGVPVFEVKRKLQTELYDNPDILKEYNWLNAIPSLSRQMHFEGTIHIFAPEDFSTKMFATSRFLSGPKEDLALQSLKLDRVFSTPATLQAFNFSLASNAKIAKSKIEPELDSCAKIFALTQKRRIATLALFSDLNWQEYSSKKREAVSFANALLQKKSESFEPCVLVDSKYQLKLLTKENLKSITVLSNSKDPMTKFEFGPVVAQKQNMLGLVAINLEKLAEPIIRQERFFEQLEKTLEEIKNLMELKKTILEKRSYIDKKALQESSCAVCFCGLYDVSHALDGSNPQSIAQRIIAACQKHGFAALEMPQKIAYEKFGAADRQEQTQKMLLEISQKQRKFYGFTYKTFSLKETEGLIPECPCIELSVKPDFHSAQ